MVKVSMADQQNFDVAEAKAEVLYALLNSGHGFVEAGIDENVSLLRGYQINAEALGAYKVNVGDDLVRGEGSRNSARDWAIPASGMSRAAIVRIRFSSLMTKSTVQQCSKRRWETDRDPQFNSLLGDRPGLR